jgi:prolipoprotein diacylglyceryltransferase
VIVSNMITNNSFSFSTNGSLHRFQIMYQKETSNGTGNPIELQVLLLAMGAVVCVVLIAIAFVAMKRRRE